MMGAGCCRASALAVFYQSSLSRSSAAGRSDVGLINHVHPQETFLTLGAIFGISAAARASRIT